MNVSKSKKPTAGIILAAGMSTRFGKVKQLLPLKGKPLLEWVLDACISSRLEKIVLVLGHQSQAIITALGEKIKKNRVLTVVNFKYREGMSRSLRTGLLKVCETNPSAMFLLGDQPLVDAEMIDFLLKRFWESEKHICVPVYQGQRGNPTVFSSKFYNSLLNIKKDAGARYIIEENPDQILSVKVDNPQVFRDIDTDEDLRKLLSGIMNFNSGP